MSNRCLFLVPVLMLAACDVEPIQSDVPENSAVESVAFSVSRDVPRAVSACIEAVEGNPTKFNNLPQHGFRLRRHVSKQKTMAVGDFSALWNGGGLCEFSTMLGKRAPGELLKYFDSTVAKLGFRRQQRADKRGRVNTYLVRGDLVFSASPGSYVQVTQYGQTIETKGMRRVNNTNPI